MDKAQIQAEIAAAEADIVSRQSELKKEEQLYNDILEFSRLSAERENSLNLSVTRRRNRVAGLDGLLSMVKSARLYSEHMNDMLTGVEYQSVMEAVSSLNSSVAAEKQKAADRIQQLEDEIRRLQSRVQTLQYQYDTCQEGEADGQ